MPNIIIYLFMSYLITEEVFFTIMLRHIKTNTLCSFALFFLLQYIDSANDHCLCLFSLSQKIPSLIILCCDRVIRIRAVHQKAEFLCRVTLKCHARAAEKCSVTAASSSPREQAFRSAKETRRGKNWGKSISRGS